MPTHTPWGTAQTTRIIAQGVREVSTASHGGVLFTRLAGERFLTPEARFFGTDFRGGLAYEEDCLIAIPMFEHPEWWPGDPPSVWLRRTISRSYPNYLILRGLDVDPEAYQYWLEDRETDMRRRSKDPDLIVSARNATAGSVHVTTADGRTHLVTASSYAGRVARKINLLSFCTPAKGPE